MPKRIGKCTNYASCQLAFQNADIETEGDFVCPECGQPLQDVTPVVSNRQIPTGILLYAGIGLGVLLIIVIAIFLLTKCGGESEPGSMITSTPAPVEPRPTATPHPPIFQTPTPTPPPAPTPTPAQKATPTPAPKATSTPSPTPIEEPPDQPTIPPINRNPDAIENANTRKEVLDRIDRIPNLTPAERDTLYARVNDAQVMTKVILVPFGSGQKKLSTSAIQKLCEATSAPELQELMRDPTVVFVVLGFADTVGSPEAGLRLSTDRAESVVDSLRNKCGVMNLMQPVGMGSTIIFGETAKNRVAEVWAVLP